MLRVASPLEPEMEHLVQRTIGCCIAVPRELGPGLLERIYGKAVCIEFGDAGIPFETEKSCPVYYHGGLLATQRVDIVVGGAVLLEIKAVDRLAGIHRSQVLSYLRVSKLRVALLVNFNVPILIDGLRRFVM
jgi:GxxExxY protein